jgi:HEAT repeat protein
MDPAVDPFSPLIKLLDRYKRDVHQLQPGASEEAIRAAERHLGHRLPFSLASFLRRWNGGSLFRGALILRSSSALANPNERLASLVAFADLPGGRQWAYAPDGQGDWIFGEVKDGQLIPLHDRFDRWLTGTIRRFDEDIRDADVELTARREVDPDGGWLLLHEGEALLAKGDPVEAGRRYSAATAADPSIILAWQRGGELALAEGDRERARFNLLRALRASRLPLPWPGARVIDPGALRTLGGLLPPGDPAWERELASFLDERVSDVRTADGLRLYVAVVRERARAKVERGERRAARDLWAGALDRARSFARREVLADAVLALVHLEIELGEHDEAERRLRPLLLADDAETRARGHLAIGRIAVTRQEPWAEEILEEAAQGLTDPADLALRALLCGERHLLNQRHPQARQMFMEADQHAIRAGDPTLQAWVCVGLGDCARGEGQLPQAAQTYKAAESRAHEARDPELISRVKLREGDMLAARGRAEDALACYSEAAASYKALELRAREGWARLRIARLLGPESPEGVAAARQARELFAQPPLSLAAGIGAADAFLGDPARSLPWHLNLAAIHAKDRLEAQRARPPMTRADADRPERRLGAHRVAISAMGLPVVKALDAELSRLSRDLMAASARPGDPKVTAYVAAADLLASHRSYEASQALLHQLFERPLPDAAARALKGAITRSANGALVDGLLSAVEKPGEPRSVAAAAEVLGWRREVSAAPALRRLLGPKSSRAVRRAAVVALGRIGDREATDDLLDVLEQPDLAEDVAIALLLLGDRRGVDFHGQALTSGRELANPPGEIVGRYGGPSYLLLLLGSIEDAPTERAASAVQGLGYLGDPRAVSRLIHALTIRDRTLVAVACGALELILGHREDPEEPGVHSRWERVWEDRRHQFRDGVRYRDGQPMSPAVLVKKLGDDDPFVRRGAYDELVITTGHTLPFDSEGPWRVQVAHQRAWQRWCHAHAAELPLGRWTFHGGVIG